MPIYDFACKNGHAFEKLVRTPEAEAKVRCPECNGAGKRQFSSGFAEHNSSQTKSSTSYKARQRFTRW